METERISKAKGCIKISGTNVFNGGYYGAAGHNGQIFTNGYTTTNYYTQSSARVNKIMTEEADDHLNNNFNNLNLNIQNYNGNNYRTGNTIYENEEELSERISTLKKIVEKAPKLNLEIINSNVLPQGIILKINAMGMDNSLRNNNDGYTYFGFQEDLKNPVIDYLIRPKDQEYDNRYIGKHFQIYFNIDTMKYYLKDLGNGFGTFIKIQSETILKDNSLINLGDSYLVCTLGMEDDQVVSEFAYSDNNVKVPSAGNRDYESMLNIKIFSGNNKYDPM